MPIFKLGERFCDPGGLACGAKNAQIDNKDFKIVHAWANDCDQDTCDTYINNIEGASKGHVICADVRKLDLSQSLVIDAFAFSYNDYSVVGERKGFDGSFGSLYTYGVKILKHYKPKWFLTENVGGLRSANAGSAFQVIMSDLTACGYRLYPHLLIWRF